MTKVAEDLPVGAAKRARVRAMFDTIAPRYDLMNRLMTFGLDRLWRHRAVEALAVAPGSRVLDLACGTGDLSAACARLGYRPLGADLSFGMLSSNRTGLPLLQADVAALPFPDASLDAVICGYALRNFADLPPALAECARVLRPGGRLSLLEVALPPSRLLRAGHRIWFEHGVPALGSLLSDADAYHYLPRSTSYLPATTELRAMLVAVGFATVGHQLLQGGLSQLFTATRVGMPPGAGVLGAPS